MSLAALTNLYTQPPASAASPEWTLVWSDKFNRLDTEKWTLVDNNIPTNNSLQDYLPQQVSVRRGKLIILAENRPSRGLAYRSGQVVSKAEQKHGRWEVRAKLPAGQGMWPAIWLLPDLERYPWPGGGEIDIVENRGNQPNLTSSAFHYGTRSPYLHEFVYSEQRSAGSRGLANYHNSFHTYAVDWTEDRLSFYVDGVNHYTVHDDDVDGFLSASTQPMRLVINNAIGGDFLPNPDQTTDWPQKMEVDWVKVYTRGAENPAASLVNGDFEAYGGALHGWSVFGNRVEDSPNVSVSGGVAGDGYAALKLFGMFSPEPSFSGVSQGVSVAPGDEVTASVDAFVSSADSIAGTDNRAELKIEFYSRFGGKHGSDQMVGEKSVVVADGKTEQDSWRRHDVTMVAPREAKEARLSLVFSQPGTASGAVYLDNARLTSQASR